MDRFRRERQLLARLEHTGIARLLDGGLNDLGEPYLVMEYVEGLRLDSYCEKHRPGTEPLLRLFVRICAAVTAAHQRLIVNRDLKPGNILVSSGGEPKLLDFGIAKVIDAEAGVELTSTANLFLTPLYASPETLRGAPATVGSDVYSLGAILYEVLSGQRPGVLAQSATGNEPARPSAVAPRERAAMLSGDLDAIVLRSLATDPAHRYISVAQFSEDLERYLEGRPVLAMKRSRQYVARKFIRRHWVPVAASLLIVLSLAGRTGRSAMAGEPRATGAGERRTALQ